MKTLPLGRTGLTVSAICLGTMTWGTQNTEAEGHAQIDLARDHSVNFMDTAEMYPVNPVRAETVGRTEEIIGAWNAKTGRRADWVIATKIAGAGSAARGAEPITGASIRRALEASLRRLRTDYVDLYQFHWPNRGSYHFRQIWGFDPGKQDPAAIRANMEECVATLGDLMRQGKLRAWGLSNESAWGMAEWLRLSDQAGVARPVSIQNEYSLLCRYFDTDLGELSHNESVTLLAYSPLAAGLLSGKYKGDVTPPLSRRSLNATLGGRVTPRVWDALDAYEAVAREAGLSMAQLAVAWTMARSFPVIPIVGATSTGQLEVTLSAAGLRLSPDVAAAISTVHKAHPIPF